MSDTITRDRSAERDLIARAGGDYADADAVQRRLDDRGGDTITRRRVTEVLEELAETIAWLRARTSEEPGGGR